jgi:hypothetical protein
MSFPLPPWGGAVLAGGRRDFEGICGAAGMRGSRGGFHNMAEGGA